MPSPIDAEIAAAEARLREAQADYDRIKAAHDAEVTADRDAAHPGGVKITTDTFAERGLTDQPQRQTQADALACIRKKHGRTRSEQIAKRDDSHSAHLPATPTDGGGTSAEDGRAEAKRRAAR